MSEQRAARLVAPRCFVVEGFPRVDLAARQVRVRVEGCGVCASSLPLWEGRRWFDYPLLPGAPGHEGWGVVEEVGPMVDSPRPGDRVAFLCDNAFTSHQVLDVDQVCPLPPELDGRDFPGEALGCAMNILERAEIRPEDRVVVLGSGFLGTLLVELAHSIGAPVVAVSRRPYSRHLAGTRGALLALDFEPDPTERLMEISRGQGFSRVLECTGCQAGLDLATALAGERGRLIIAGYHQDGLRQVNLQQWNWKGLDVINAHERDPQVYLAGMRRAVRAMVEGRMRGDELLTHRLPLEEIEAAFRLAEVRPYGFVKAVVTP